MTETGTPMQRLAKMFELVECLIRRLMMEDKEIDRTQRRIHGFAEGDRVAVVDGDDKDAYGKLTYVTGGWCYNATNGNRRCRNHCRIFRLNIQGGPAGADALGDEKWFPAAKLTHVD